MQLFDWHSIAISPSDSIREALTVLDQQSLQIVLVVDDNQALVGTVTDGDVRRALLRGETLNSEVSSAMNRSPTIGLNNETEVVWHQKMLRKSLRHLPIADENNKVIGLYYQKGQVTEVRKNPIVLMLGGQGMRLRPLTETVPKPMLMVGNQPILETIVKHIAEQGFTEFYFCINYLGEQIRKHFGNGEKWGINITYIQENAAMGTAGALSLLPLLPKEPFIVMNGDLLTKINLCSLIKFHKEHDNKVTACVREYTQQVPYGVVELDGSYVSQMVEKPSYRYFVNAGIYCLSPETLQLVPQNEFYDMPTLIAEILSDKEKVGGFPITEYWMDIGQMPDFEQAQMDYEVYFNHLDEVG
ncbi:nucleotidyltransferase family protein [Thiomicrorhabdus sediminis]|uniref:CBS domain-containing protein n=1 Tax=Thiomicrorhabdus sediminis TaxID=2580412 RepID=A0A4P9K648_9GAMM|nr:nucleotidyltransferase family protein [Thiomicrorhabdus sediminis]QCU90469.1 CBS domain-containing protein [Thiomicrorhabdus sediminis]